MNGHMDQRLRIRGAINFFFKINPCRELAILGTGGAIIFSLKINSTAMISHAYPSDIEIITSKFL